MHSIQDDMRIVNKIPDATGLTTKVYDCRNLMLTKSECIVSRGLYAARQIRHRVSEAI